MNTTLSEVYALPSEVPLSIVYKEQLGGEDRAVKV